MSTNETEKPSNEPPTEAAPKRKRRKPKPPPETAAPARDDGAKKVDADEGITNVFLIGLFVLAATGAVAVLASRRDAQGTGRAATAEVRDIELTLVAADKKNLACASPTEVRGRRCEFEAADKRSAKAGDADDLVLRPYTTSDGHSLLVAGVFSQHALASTLPAGRFTARCKFQREGRVSKPSVRWAATGPWTESSGTWEAGTVSDCAVVPQARPPAAASAPAR